MNFAIPRNNFNMQNSIYEENGLKYIKNQRESFDCVRFFRKQIERQGIFYTQHFYNAIKHDVLNAF